MGYGIITLKKGEGRLLKSGGPGFLTMRSERSREILKMAAW